MNSPETFVRLLGELRDHLTAPQLCSDLASVQVVATSEGPQAAVQLCGFGLGEVATGLLEWADTLTEIIATAWRPPDGDRVHLRVNGRLGDGLVVQVYGAVPYSGDVFEDLHPGGRQSLALSVLRSWAIGGAVAA